MGEVHTPTSVRALSLLRPGGAESFEFGGTDFLGLLSRQPHWLNDITTTHSITATQRVPKPKSTCNSEA